MRSGSLVVKVCGALALAGIATAGGTLLLRWYAGPAGWEQAVKIASVIGGVGSAFSAVAVLAAIAAVYLQAIALEEQRQELRAAQEDQARQAATMQHSIELQALSALVSAQAALASTADKAKGGGHEAQVTYVTVFGELRSLIRRLELALGDQAAPSSATSTPAESVK